MNDKPLRSIIVPPGIGDGLWLIQKLVNSGERFHFKIPGGLPQRGKAIYDLMPYMGTGEYVEPIKYSTIKQHNAGKGKWSAITANDFYLSANEHLEVGKRIERFLPDLPTSYHIDFDTTEQDRLRAESLLPDGVRYIGIYTSAYSNARNWNGWRANEWFSLISQLEGFTFVLIGAPYDVGVTEELTYMMDADGIKFINTIGEPLSVVIEMMKRSAYFIGFPSGLSILNELTGNDGLMFYPPHLQPMIGKWCAPERGNGFKECLFTDPSAIAKWLKDEYKIMRLL